LKKSDMKVGGKKDDLSISLGKRLGDTLAKHAKILSVFIIVMMALPIAAVGMRISPQERTLPPALDFRMLDVETGNTMRLSDYMDRVVFIDFMATWCVTCRQSMADLEQIYDRYFSTLSFIMLSVTTSTTDNVSLMRDFKNDYSANWTFAIPMFVVDVGMDYGVNGYPTYIIVDRDGQIAYRSVGLTPLSTMVSRIDEILKR